MSELTDTELLAKVMAHNIRIMQTYLECHAELAAVRRYIMETLSTDGAVRDKAHHTLYDYAKRLEAREAD